MKRSQERGSQRSGSAEQGNESSENQTGTVSPEPLSPVDSKTMLPQTLEVNEPRIDDDEQANTAVPPTDSGGMGSEVGESQGDGLEQPSDDTPSTSLSPVTKTSLEEPQTSKRKQQNDEGEKYAGKKRPRKDSANQGKTVSMAGQGLELAKPKESHDLRGSSPTSSLDSSSHSSSESSDLSDTASPPRSSQETTGAVHGSQTDSNNSQATELTPGSSAQATLPALVEPTPEAEPDHTEEESDPVQPNPTATGTSLDQLGSDPSQRTRDYIEEEGFDVEEFVAEATKPVTSPTRPQKPPGEKKWNHRK